MKIKPQAAIILTLAIMIIGIAVTSAFGLFKTTATKIPAKLKDPQYSEAYNPSDIRGSYTFSDINKLYNIPIEELSEAFGIDKTKAPDFKCKDLESLNFGSENKIGLTSVKLFVAYYLGLPYNPTEETYVPQAAAEILFKKDNMVQGQRDYLGNHTILNNQKT